MRYTFHINSSKRSNGSNTNFNINTNLIINKLATNSSLVVSIHNVQIPFSFYQLSTTSGLNILPIYIKNVLDATGINTNITISPGNYTAYTIITALNTALTTACQQTGISGFTPFSPTFNTSYNPTNGYITFALTAPIGCLITLKFSTSNITGLLGNFFGVGQNDIVMTTSTTPTSTQPCVLNPVNYLCIRSSLKQFRNREFIFVPDDVSDVLCKIPILTQQGTYVQWIEPTEPIYIIDNSINSINFYLTNNLTYDPINLQNLPWSFTFSITEILRPDYKALSSTQALNLLYNPIKLNEEDELNKLEKQRDEIISKLDVYKKKISLPKVEADKVADKVADSSEQIYKAVYDTSSSLQQYKDVLYGNMFETSPPPESTGSISLWTEDPIVLSDIREKNNEKKDNK
jgi:hypothetical protein